MVIRPGKIIVGRQKIVCDPKHGAGVSKILDSHLRPTQTLQSWLERCWMTADIACPKSHVTAKDALRQDDAVMRADLPTRMTLSGQDSSGSQKRSEHPKYNQYARRQLEWR